MQIYPTGSPYAIVTIKFYLRNAFARVMQH